MTRLTRRGFLKKSSAGAVAIGALGAVPGAALAAGHAHVPEMPAADAADMDTAESFVVYVRNPAAGEMAMLVGSHEITHTDRALAARLWQIARNGHGASALHSDKR